MVLIIIATLLVLAFAFYQTVQGMFSAIIMAVLTVLCSALALNYFEPLAHVFVSKGWLGAYAHGVCLLALFVVPLLILREVFDRVIPGNVVMGMWVDRIGGAAFGLITGLVLVGMLMIVLQLLPLPASILTYQPYTTTLEVDQGLTPRWSSKLVLGLAKQFSAGALSPIGDGQKFGLRHDDLLLDAFCVRNRPSGAWAGTPPDALEVTDAYRVQMPDARRLRELKLRPDEIARLRVNVAKVQKDAPKYSLSRREKTALYAVRVSVKDSARDKVDDWFRLPATHFRLVTETGRSFYPVGYLAFVGQYRVQTVIPKKAKLTVASVADILVARQWLSASGPSKLYVDWLYQLPEWAKPEYLAFRRAARSDLPPLSDGLPEPADSKGRRLALNLIPLKGRRRGGGATGFESVAGSRLIRPTTMRLGGQMPSAFQVRVGSGGPPAILANVNHDKVRFKSGILAGPASQLGDVPREAYRVREFDAPQRSVEEGGRKVSRPATVVQVECQLDRPFPAGSADAVITNLNPQVILDNSATHPHSGAYLTYATNAGRHVYLYYDAGSSRARLEPGFRATLRRHVAKVEQIGFIFVLPPERDRSIAGVSFTPDGTYDFFATSPLPCGRGR